MLKGSVHISTTNFTECKEIMQKKYVRQKHISNLIRKTGFKKLYIATQIGLSASQLSHAINGYRVNPEHREAIFCFLKHYVSEVKKYSDVWLEDRPGTIYFKAA